MLSQLVHAHLGLIYLITLKDSGIRSSTSEISFPIVRKLSPPQASHFTSGGIITSSLGKCAGNFFLLACPFDLISPSKLKLFFDSKPSNVSSSNNLSTISI